MTYDMGGFILRGEPLHNGHLKCVRRALEVAKTAAIYFGSSGQARDTFNPWTFEERKAMLLGSLPAEDRSRVSIQPIYDIYNDTKWMMGVQEAANTAAEELGLKNPTITLVGHSKDHTSYYLDMFPQWDSVNVGGWSSEKNVLSATSLRDKLFLADDPIILKRDLEKGLIADLVPDFVNGMLTDFVGSPVYDELVGEFRYIRDYKLPYKNLPHRVGFTTADTCIFQSGHVLLVKRKNRPGKGLWALPGGFVEMDRQTVDQAWTAELYQETKLKVPEAVIRGNLKHVKMFDAINRSARGRIITHCHLVLLPNGPLPKVRGADDAEKAKWTPLAELRRDNMFEDHYKIIEYMRDIAEKHTY